MREFMSFMRNNNMLVNDIAIFNKSSIWLFRLPSLQLSCKNLSHLLGHMCKYTGYNVFKQILQYTLNASVYMKYARKKYKPLNIFK